MRCMSSKILLIEDEPSLRKNLELLLTMERYAVTTAADGVDGLRYLQEERFDLVITDVMMGEVSGFDVLEHISTHHPDTPVILFTGYGTNDLRQEALRKGAYRCIPKPFDVEDFLTVVRKALS
ncbi:MAG: response regulator [Nitrospinota bacterium]|nr:MAG: response regulator [Nitrospinota bacterium]